MTIFPMRGAHAGDLIMALPAIGAALALGEVTVAGIAPRYFGPFRRLPVTFLFSEPNGLILRRKHERGRHQTDLWLESLPERLAPVRLDLPVPEIKHAAVLLSNGPWILLSPWSDFPPKRWTVDGWQAVAAHAMRQGCQVAVLGPPQSTDLCAAIAASGCLNLAGRDSPSSWPSLIACGSLVITTDSAACHVADALDIPVIGLYGQTKVAEFGPYWRRELCVEGDGMRGIPASAVCERLDHWGSSMVQRQDSMPELSEPAWEASRSPRPPITSSMR